MNPKMKGKPSKGKRPYVKKDFTKEEVKDNFKSKCNDPSWYIREGQLAKDVASFSFNNALGNVVSVKPDDEWTQFKGLEYTVPGIMRIHTMPAVGVSLNGSSPINIAAKNLYSWVRHANSGHSNYDSPDLILYLMAMDSIYALIWHLQRAYGTARVYSQKNRYIGDALLHAMGFIGDDVRKNLSDFRAYINMLIVKASAFNTPISMSIFKRHTWMYSGVYKDEEVTKSQVYLYVPTYLWRYEEVTGNPGSLSAKPVIANLSLGDDGVIAPRNMLVSQWEAIGDDLIAALVNSEDINIMSGDILKAYGDGGVWKINLIPEDFVTVPIYSGEILDQIHNTVFTGGFPINLSAQPSIERLGVAQDALVEGTPLKFQPIFRYAYNTCFEHFCDMEEEEPSPERILVATRNMVHTHMGEVGTSVGQFLDSCGSDICFYGEISILNYGISGAVSPTYKPIGRDFNDLIDVSDYTKFHKAPIVYRVEADTTVTPTNFEMKEVIGELGNYVILDKTDIEKMHQSAILSMLGVPV